MNPALAIVFASIKTDWRSIRNVLHEGGMDVLGATSCGEFTNGQQSEGGAAILLLDLPRSAYTVLFEDMHDREVPDVARKVAARSFEIFNRPAFILCTTGISADGDMFPGAAFLHCLEEAAGPGLRMHGGMAGDDATFTGTYVFTHEQVSDAGVAALVLDEDKIGLYSMALSGWKPLGITRTVTRSEGEWLLEIDGQPALEMYLRYLGRVEGVDHVSSRLFDDIGIHYPFQVEGAGDPVMRTPMGSDAQRKALKLDFGVPVGSTLRFSTPPDFDIVENVLDKAREVKASAQTDAEAVLVFSCAGRLSALGPLVNAENDGLARIWNAPMAGFFTYGEYGTRQDGGQEFHSTTCCWVALKER
jgi:hypothetical protein